MTELEILGIISTYLLVGVLFAGITFWLFTTDVEVQHAVVVTLFWPLIAVLVVVGLILLALFGLANVLATPVKFFFKGKKQS